MNTLLLDQKAVDLVLDAAGNIALASDPYSVAQDVASAIRTFQGECWYDTSAGIPYFARILGKVPPLSFIKAQMVRAALTVPGVSNAACYITSTAGGKVTGQVTFTDSAGATNAVGF